MSSYGRLSGSSSGIPRGVGVSAYLSELYLRPVDKKIKELQGIILYCRYVDDIIAVFARPPESNGVGSYLDAVVKAIRDNGLQESPDKTAAFISGGESRVTFHYLGYRFRFFKNQCEIWPGANKVAKYKTRLLAAFKSYHKESPCGHRQAHRELVARVKFLTGNTRLTNSKSNALTGIYYNNSIATEQSSFVLLDKVLRRQIAKIGSPKLRKRLKSLKFKEGFEQKRFHKFSPDEFQMIVKVWKHG